MNFLPRMQQHVERFKETGSCNCITFKLQHYNMQWVRWNSHLTYLLQRKNVLCWDGSNWHQTWLLQRNKQTQKEFASNMLVAKKEKNTNSSLWDHGCDDSILLEVVVLVYPPSQEISSSTASLLLLVLVSTWWLIVLPSVVGSCRQRKFVQRSGQCAHRCEWVA